MAADRGRVVGHDFSAGEIGVSECICGIRLTTAVAGAEKGEDSICEIWAEAWLKTRGSTKAELAAAIDEATGR